MIRVAGASPVDTPSAEIRRSTFYGISERPLPARNGDVAFQTTRVVATIKANITRDNDPRDFFACVFVPARTAWILGVDCFVVIYIDGAAFDNDVVAIRHVSSPWAWAAANFFPPSNLPIAFGIAERRAG
jgi:hypothetical protein